MLSSNKFAQKQTGNNISKLFSLLADSTLLITALFLFGVSILAVHHLTPQTIVPKEPSVLGESMESAEKLKYELIDGAHNYIISESLLVEGTNTHIYKAVLKKREARQYSKPILEVSNTSYDPLCFSAFASTETKSQTRIGLLVNNTNYVLISEDGDVYKHSFKVNPRETALVYLSIKNDTAVRFDNVMSISLVDSSK